MLYQIFVTVLILFVVHAGLKRLLGVLLSYLASNKRFRLTVDTVDFLVVRGIVLQLHQGILAEVRVAELRLGRSNDITKAAKGVWRALSTYNMRLPCTVQGLHLAIRQSKPPEAQALSQGRASKKKSPQQLLWAKQLLMSLAARFGVAVLPAMPFRAKGLFITLEGTGFACEVPRIDLSIQSRRLSSKVDITARIQPIQACIRGNGEGDAAQQTPVLQVGAIAASAVLQVCSMFPGLHCQVVAGTIPSIAVTLSPKLLAIASQLRAASKAARAGRPRRVQQGKPMDAGRLGVLLPSEVDIRLPAVQCAAIGFGISESSLSQQLLSWEGLSLVCSSSAPLPGNTSEAQSDAELLYTARVHAGRLQVGAGLEASEAAVALEFASLDTTASLTRAASKLSSSQPECNAAARACISGIAGSCCADSALKLLGVLSQHAPAAPAASVPQDPPVLNHQVMAQPEAPAADAAGTSESLAEAAVVQSDSSPDDQHKTLLTWELVLETQDSLGVRLRDVAGHTLAQACVQSVIGRAQSTAGAVDGLLAGLELQDLEASVAPASIAQRQSDAGDMSKLFAVAHVGVGAAMAVGAPGEPPALDGSIQVQGLAVSADKHLLESGLHLVKALPRLPRKQRRSLPPQHATTSRKRARLKLAGLKAEVLDTSVQYSCVLHIPPHQHRCTADLQPGDAAAADAAVPYTYKLMLGTVSCDVSPSLSGVACTAQGLCLEHVQRHGPGWDDAAVAAESATRGVVFSLADSNVNLSKPQPSQAAGQWPVPSVAAELSGLRLALEADHLFAACSLAAEVLATCRAQLHPAEAAQPSATPPPSAQAAQQRPAGKRRASLFPVSVTARLNDADISVHCMDGVLWGMSIVATALELQPTSKAAASLAGLAVSLNTQRLLRLGAVDAALLALNLTPAEPPCMHPEAGQASSRQPLPESQVEEASTSGTAASDPSAVWSAHAQSPLPEQPYNGSSERALAACTRAHLPGTWHPPFREGRPSESQASSPLTDASTSPQSSLAMPLASLEACLQDCDVSLPHDCEMGMAIRGTELWARAFEVLLRERLQPLLAPRKRAGQHSSGKALLGGSGIKRRPLELFVCLRRASFRMDLPPMEAFLAIHGPLLRNASVKGAMWDRGVAAVADFQQKRASWHGLHEHSSRFVMHDAIHTVMSNEYLASCRQAAEKGPPGAGGAAMLVSVEAVDALAVLCSTDPASTADAEAFIKMVDPPSAGVALRQVRKLHVDAELCNASVFFSGASQPLASADGTVISGLVGVARQATVPPQQYRRTMQVGRCWKNDIDVTVKGSRPQPKFYTDLHCCVEGVNGCYGIGMEPSIWQVSQAGKRMSSSDPDRTRPKMPTLPWWDMLRYIWRGHVAIDIRQLEFDLAACPDTDINYKSERLHAAGESLFISVGKGAMEIESINLSATACRGAGLTKQPASTLHILPLCDFPHLQATLTPQWQLSGGGHPDHHHLFPVPVPEQEGYRQEPVVAYDVFRTLSWGLDIAASVDSGALQQRDSGKEGSQAGGGSAWQYGDSGPMAAVYIGDQQVAFMKGFIEVFQTPPPWLRMPNKRGTYFRRLDPNRIPIKALPKLLSGLTVAAEAVPLTIHNYTLDVDDPSCGLRLTLGRVRYMGKTLLNRPAPRPVLPTMSRITSKREANRVASFPLVNDVSAGDIFLHWADDLADEEPLAAGQQVLVNTGGNTTKRLLMRRSSSLSNSMGATGERALPSSATSTPRRLPSESTSEPILMAGEVSVYESRPHPDEASRDENGNVAERRPLQVKLSDCRLCIDLAGRNALWAAVVRLIAATKLPRKFGSQRQSFADPDSSPSPMQRRPSHTQPASASKGGGTDLLQLLLQQGQRSPRASSNQGDDEPVDGPISSGGDHTADTGDSSGERAVPLDALAGDDEGLSNMPDTHPQALLAEARQLAVEARAQQDAEWRQGLVNMAVEVTHFQASMASERGLGHLLLAMPKAELTGRVLHGRDKALSLNVDQMQAHMLPMDIDPEAPTMWLEIEGHDMHALPGSQIRQICAPFTVSLRHLQQKVGGLDTQLIVPDVDIAMTSRDFQALMDVINITGLAPGPTVESVGKDRSLMGQPENDEVDVALDAYINARQTLMSLQMEASALRESMGIKLQRVLTHTSSWRSTGSHASSVGRWASIEMLQLASMEEDIADAELSLRAYLEGLQEVDTQQPLGFSGAEGVGQRLLLRWAEQQWGATRDTLVDATKTLQDFKKAAARLAMGQHAKRFLLEVDTVAWGLLQDASSPFMQVRIGGVLLDNQRNRDKSGSSKLVVQHLQVMDHTGTIGATAYTQPGAILIPWNPDESYARDALLHVQAKLGSPTPDFAIYEHMDVMVHPLGVHLTEKFASQIWEFFFPKEDETTKRQEAWVKAVEPRPTRGHGRKSSSLSVQSDADSSAGHTLALSNPSSSRPGSPEAASSHAEASSGRPPATLVTSSSSGSAKAADKGQARGFTVREAAGAASALMASGTQDSGLLDTLLKQGAGPLARLAGGHRKTASLTEAGPEIESKPAGSGRRRHRRKKKVQKQSAAMQRKLRFEHVRINRVILRTTFQGPVKISDFKVVLDKRVYRNLEGGWPDLFNRLKWDVVKSVAKSSLGFQKGKVKELVPQLASRTSEGSDSDTKAAGSKRVMTWIRGVGAKERPDAPAGSDPSTAKDRAKSLMLLGKGPNPSSKAVAAKHAAPSLAPAPRPGEAPEEAEAGRQGSLSKPVPPDPLQLLLERPQAARPGLMDVVKASLPTTQSLRRTRDETTTWLPRDVPMAGGAAAADESPRPASASRSPMGTPKSERLSPRSTEPDALHSPHTLHTGYSSEGSNLETGSRPGTPSSFTQVNPEPLGLSLSDLLTQPQRFEPTHNGFDDSPPASMLRRPPGPPSPTRPPPSPLHPAAPANAKEQQKKPTLAQRMRGSAAMHKADTALKGLFSSGPGKKHAGPAPSLAPTLAKRGSGSMQAAPHLLDQAPPEPFQRSRAAPALDMSSLLAPADPTHRRMISDAESVVGSQAHPQQQAQQQAQPPLLASPIGGVVEQARGFRAEPERHEGSAALHQPPEGPSFSPLGDALPHQPAPPAWAADFQPRVPGDLAVTPSEDADDDGGLVDDLLDLLPAHSGIAVEQGSAEVGPTHQQQGLDRGPAGMHSVSSLHDWVGSQRAASAPPAESDRDTASMVPWLSDQGPAAGQAQDPGISLDHWASFPEAQSDVQGGQPQTAMQQLPSFGLGDTVQPAPAPVLSQRPSGNPFAPASPQPSTPQSSRFTFSGAAGATSPPPWATPASISSHLNSGNEEQEPKWEAFGPHGPAQSSPFDGPH